MLNRRKALIGAAALAAPAAATAAQSDDALIEKCAAALYEAYYEAQRVAYGEPYWVGGDGARNHWRGATAADKDFARAQARATLSKLGLLSPKGTV